MRAGILAAWRDSPTRLREDAATEADLVRAGYRDRLLTELAQNAADAARRAGVPGRLAVRLAGDTLHVMNTGAPLDLSGVHALTALRASGKSETGENVGRFGVGFTAVRSVSDEIELRSRAGGLCFSLTATRAALTEAAVPETETAPAVLRLAWPAAHAPADGWDTEIVLLLRDEVDRSGLRAAMRAEAVDLLLELPALREIRIGEDVFTAEVTPVPSGPRHPADVDGPVGAIDADILGDHDGDGDSADDSHGSGGPGLEEVRVHTPDGSLTWWQYRTRRSRWLLPVRDGRPVPVVEDVLRAPTRSDEELSLPALLVADLPMQPDRRRALPGARVSPLAEGYADFARALPEHARLALVPAPGFARSEIDGLLREALLHELRTHPWLPVLGPVEHGIPGAAPTTTGAVLADPGAESGRPVGTLEGAQAARAHSASASDGPDAVPSTRSAVLAARRATVALPTRASVFPGLTAELAVLLDELIGPLVPPGLSGPAHAEALAVLDVHRLGLARVAESTSGLRRPPAWWRALYAALEPFVVDPVAAEALGALAVPLSDDRVVTGPRTVVLDDGLGVAVALPWARLVHPQAAHPLLARLGARTATAADLLADPALRAHLDDDPGDPDIVDAVLRLVPRAAPQSLPAWLGLLELPDSTGAPRPADELLLPGAPLGELLVADSPFGVVAAETVREYGAEALRAIGVGWNFGLVSETDPTGPDHHLDDEEHWWAGLESDPEHLVAVRDLDLVDDAAWPRALRLLTTDPRTADLFTDPRGYTPWWLREHARYDGIPLGHHRFPGDPEFAGLLPDFPAADVDPARLALLRTVLADPAVIDTDLAHALLDALADPRRRPDPAVVAGAHRRLAAAVAGGRLDVAELDLPDRVRALSGAAVDAREAMVLDLPWFGLAISPQRLVAGSAEHADALAGLLDLPLVSEAVSAEVLGEGRHTTWSEEPLAVVLAELFAAPVAGGELVLHTELRVRLDGAVRGTVAVPWWREGAVTHVLAPEPIG
ncbi:sacsin N-terminal ATP-binding-like domain-containing protein [Nocardia higoensis]|uniref:sacsin N-terminal ATP-binding-like domain-containing protein n=1 Tax=Nocardia higoensis TaxID=228599 RepID=UPI001E5BD3E4|nr:ATP-binding protein [Nocardia higoensis]